MKKLLIISAVLLINSVCYADTQTSGSVKLLKPSTGTIDTNRSWADKINSNFDIIASTLGNLVGVAQNPVIFSSNIVDGQVMGRDIAAGTISSSHTNLPSFNSLLYINTNYFVVNSGSVSIQGTFISTNGFAVNGASVTTITFPDGTIQKTAPTASVGGSGGVSSFTWTLASGGDVYLATNSLIPIPGAYGVVGKSTINVTSVQPFTLIPSTRGWSSFNIARSTQMTRLNQGATWQYTIVDATAGVNETYGLWVSTNFQLYPNYFFFLVTTSVTSNLGGGASAQEYGMKMRGWVDTNGGD